MRSAFIKALVEIAEKDKRVMLLTGDLGYMALEPFKEKFPDRFINVGVAEQNMVGLATGLAESGLMPFVYSIAPFVTLRPYEFIRNGPILHRLPVRIVGVGGGFEYGHNGITHYALEDIAVMRTQPDLTVIAPADRDQARAAVLATWDMPGPIYYRFGKDDKKTVPGLDGRFTFGKNESIGKGKDVLFVTMGSIASEAVAAAEILNSRGIAASTVIVSTLNPAPAESLAQMIKDNRLVVTVEAHYANGGLGSLVAETIAEGALKCTLVRCAVTGAPQGVSGSREFMHRLYGLDAESLAKTAATNLKGNA